MQAEQDSDIDLSKVQWVMQMPYGRLGAQLVDGDKLFIHCDIWEWSPSIMRDLKVRWKQFCDYFKAYGVERLYSCIDNKRPLVHKWQKLWGLKLVKRTDNVSFYMKELNDGI